MVQKLLAGARRSATCCGRPPVRRRTSASEWSAVRVSRETRGPAAERWPYVTYARGLRGHALEDRLQDGFRRLPVGVRVEIQNDAMPQHRRRHVLHVFDRTDGSARASAPARARTPPAPARRAANCRSGCTCFASSCASFWSGCVAITSWMANSCTCGATSTWRQTARTSRIVVAIHHRHRHLALRAGWCAPRCGSVPRGWDTSPESSSGSGRAALRAADRCLPSRSGFCVAITRNGASSSCVVVPLVTVRSCMASSSADCVFGVARLISSASTRLAKIGPGWKRSVLPPRSSRLHDHAADDIGGHQVRRELDARVLQLQRARQRAQQRGLAQARNAFEQHVSAGEQADEHAFDHVVLAYDDFGDFPADGVQPVNGKLESRFRSHVFHCRAGDG